MMKGANTRLASPYLYVYVSPISFVHCKSAGEKKAPALTVITGADPAGSGLAMRTYTVGMPRAVAWVSGAITAYMSTEGVVKQREKRDSR